CANHSSALSDRAWRSLPHAWAAILELRKRAKLLLLNLLLNLPSKLKRMSYRAERLGRPASSTNDNRAVAEYPTQQTFLNSNALHFGQEQFSRSSAQKASLYGDAPVRHSHFGCLSSEVAKQDA